MLYFIGSKHKVQKQINSKTLKQGNKYKSLKNLRIKSPGEFHQIPSQREKEYIDLSSFQENFNRTAHINDILAKESRDHRYYK